MSLAVGASPLSDRRLASGLVFGVALLLRLVLIWAYPEMFGGDSVVRLANSDKVVLSYQLPALQAVIWLCAKVTWNPLLVRVAVALMAAWTSVGVYRLAVRLMPAAAALGAGLWFAAHPFVATYSIVPYQEILMLGALAWAFELRWSDRRYAASAALALACLTRYEAWLACPIFIAAAWRTHGHRTGLWAVLLYGWAPAIWMVWHQGVTPAGGFAVESAMSWERLHRWLYLAWITLKTTPPVVAAVAAWGTVEAWRRRRDVRLQELAAFLALFGVAILLSAHGERADPDRWVTAREAHIPIAAVMLLGGLGLAVAGRWRWPLALAGLALGVWMAQRSVAQETSDPHVALSYQASRWIDAHVAPGETVVILAKPVPRAMLERFLHSAADQAAAREMLLSLNAAPPDRQRILVQSRLGPDRLLSLSSFPEDLVPNQPEPSTIEPDWILRWSDFAATNRAEAALADRLGPPAVELRSGAVSLVIARAE